MTDGTKQPDQQEFTSIPMVVDRVDGSKESFGIRRFRNEQNGVYTAEYWNIGGWAAFCYVFKDKKLAESIRDLLAAQTKAPTDPSKRYWITEQGMKGCKMTAQEFYSEVWIKEHGSDPRGDWPIRFAEACAAHLAGTRTLEGTYECPICGCATPHGHSEEQVAEWRLQEECRSACFCCRGESLLVESQSKRNGSGFYFHRGNGQMFSDCACLAQPIQTRIWDLLRKPASCGCDCSGCRYVEYEWSDGTGEHCKITPCIAAHSEAASPPEAEQFLESLPARETFPINRTETAELLTKFADWLLRRPVPTFTMCSADIGKVSPVIVEAAAPPQGTPAPEPDSCPTCGSGNRKLPLVACPVHDSFAELCSDPWHSTVAAQKEKP